jgi:hypothetical protein
MARPETLIPGNCYFVLQFHDDELLFPAISTLAYVGSEIDESGRSWLFREAGSGADESLLALSDEQLYQVVDFPGLLEKLREVAADHPLRSSPESGIAATAAPDDLRENVEKFLTDPRCAGFTATIRFTDDGLSLKRDRDGGRQIGFFTHPRRGTDEEERIRTLFAGLGTAPHEDYLADRGRTRILEFPAPEDVDALLRLCSRVLIEVYALRADDRLEYSFVVTSNIDP